MAKFRNAKTSFLAGEISPTAFGRIDIQNYAHACKTMRNMIPFASGGCYRRPGSIHVASISGATDHAPRVIPFVVSKNESYAVLMGQVFNSSSYTNIYRGNSNVTNQQVAVATVTGALPYVASVTSNFATIGAYDEWHDVQYIQSADVMTTLHPLYMPYRVTRTSQDNFTIATFNSGFGGSDLRKSFPFMKENADAEQNLRISATGVGAGKTLYAETSGGVAIAGFFQTGHIGSMWKIFDGTNNASVQVTAVTLGGSQCTVTTINDFASTARHSTWWESAWSDYRGWPRTAVYYQRRIVYGGNDSFPDTMWCSQIDNYDIMSADDADPRSPASTTGPFTIELSSQTLNLINWIIADRTLVVGTQGDEWLLQLIDGTLGFIPGNILAVPQTHFGSAYNQAVKKGNEIVFNTSGESELRALVFNQVYYNSYTDDPIQTLYDEFPKAEPSGTTLGNRKIRSFSWDETRRTLWCIDTAGNLVGLTRDRQSSVNLWHSHQMGGFDSSVVGDPSGVNVGGGVYTIDPAYVVCAGSVISVTVLPNPLIGTNDIWLVVRRYINSAWTYHLERIIGRNHPFESAYQIPNPEGSYYVDDAVYVDNVHSSPSIVASVFLGLDHLKGELPFGTAFNTKGIFKVTGAVVDNSGHSTLQSISAFHLDTEVYTIVVMGLPYNSIVEPVRIEAGSQVGTAQGALKRIHQLTMRFYRTLSAKFGRDSSDLETLVFRDPTAAIGKSPDLFTGDKTRSFNGTYDYDGLVYILQDQPLPFALISLIAEGETSD